MPSESRPTSRFSARGTFTFTSPLGDIRIYMNTEEMDAYLEADPYADPKRIAELLSRMETSLGFYPIPEEECPAVTTEEGWTRVYLTPVVPIADDGVDELDYELAELIEVAL